MSGTGSQSRVNELRTRAQLVLASAYLSRPLTPQQREHALARIDLLLDRYLELLHPKT